MALELYTYEPLKSSIQIRLLKLYSNEEKERLEAVIEHHNLEDAIKTGYEAISYCWGEPLFTHQLHIEGRSLNITPHLHGALSVLTESYIWVDAVCINQEDPEEKARQIPLMRRIYANADVVLVWLGPENPLIINAMQVIDEDLYEEVVSIFNHETLEPHQRRANVQDRLKKSGVMMGLNLILENDWFTRLWVSSVVIWC